MDFLFYKDGEGFFAHVTAVYNPGGVESNYVETIFVQGAMIGIENYDTLKPKIYPNPSKGIIQVENKNLDRIIIYDLAGRIIKDMHPQPQLDLSDFTKGIYLIKLISGTKSTVEKIILE